MLATCWYGGYEWTIQTTQSQQNSVNGVLITQGQISSKISKHLIRFKSLASRVNSRQWAHYADICTHTIVQLCLLQSMYIMSRWRENSNSGWKKIDVIMYNTGWDYVQPSTKEGKDRWKRRGIIWIWENNNNDDTETKGKSITDIQECNKNVSRSLTASSKMLSMTNSFMDDIQMYHGSLNARRENILRATASQWIVQCLLNTKIVI